MSVNKIFIKGTEVTENIVRVEFQHFCPFDEKEGLSPEQLAEGFLVDEIPQPDFENHPNKIPELYYDKAKGEVFYTYDKDIPPAPPTIEDLNEKIDLVMEMLLESEGII